MILQPPNPIMLTDVYNTSHYMFKENQDFEKSILMNRNRPQILFGLNETINEICNIKIEEIMVDEAYEHALRMNMPFPVNMWYRVANEFKGRIPLRVEALPDGTWCPKGTPFCKISNTEKGFGELVSWWEGVFMHSYFASGCATEAFLMRKYLDDNKLDPKRLHSFGWRGHRSVQDGIIASKAWNLSLEGTDDFVSQLYTEPKTSIPATAHKTIQNFNSETYAYIYSINSAYKKGFKVMALVIDTYDPNRFVIKHSEGVAKMASSRGIHLVFRPDSGDVLGQSAELYERMKKIGLDKKTSVIIGEGMNFSNVVKYDQFFKKEGVPLSWVNYGIGGGFYNHIDRDYLGWAMKTCYSNGKPRMKFSGDPMKKSIPGDINLIRNHHGNIEVDFTRDGGLYEDVYYFDDRSTRPHCKVQTWDEIKRIVNAQTAIQENIILSKQVKDLQDSIMIEHFANQKNN